MLKFDCNQKCKKANNGKIANNENSGTVAVGEGVGEEVTVGAVDVFGITVTVPSVVLIVCMLLQPSCFKQSGFKGVIAILIIR